MTAGTGVHETPRSAAVRCLVTPLAGLLLFLCPVAIAPVHPAERGAEVVHVQGTATAQTPGAEPRALKKASVVVEGDRIVTGDDGRVELVFADKTRITLGPNSDLTLDRYRAEGDAPEFFARVAKGVFRVLTGFIARRQPQSFKVQISVATIGIRGTQFGAEVKETSALVVLLEPEEGKSMAIDVFNQFGAVTIDQPGFGTEIPDAMSPPSPPRRMRLRAVENLIRSLSTIQRLQVPRPPPR